MGTTVLGTCFLARGDEPYPLSAFYRESKESLRPSNSRVSFFQVSQKDQGLSSAVEPMFLCLVGTLSTVFSERVWGVNATNSAPFHQGPSHQKSVSTTNRPCQGSGNWQGAWQQGKHPGTVKWAVSEPLLSLG